ncbi:multicomponent Na+:H+ antiporter subunit D [Geomicrobium halophilum]|uniref:Multicomponent Na+:H+ antiporter subunit D n=1 Tax=Geomicrobium halophilum TaxID=549000 RepID=A0A841PI88_9BACL|nr:Na+/H+ antiporter subunit D [Geomicrobium halophilum]MBB6448597.1 multicomponent Na+:H+ antiporter subunit D [Geomicrobium halophilum]
MSNIVVLPILIPVLAGALLILLVKRHRLQRFMSGLSAIATLAASLYLAVYTYNNDGIATLELGTWPAPFGIVMVADLLSVTVVAVSSLVGVCCLFFAFRTLHPERERYYFHPLFFFLITGVNGAALTGDMFNMFVFFEVMLLSSYALIVIGGTKFQLRESFKYAIINIFASMLFLAGIAYLYGITGTLNMAHIAERIDGLEETGALPVVAILFFIVFAMKGALFPLYFWLPRAYYGAPIAITALFGGLLTKVGVYAIIRTYTLIFTQDVAFTHHFLILLIAGFTMLIGVLGAVSSFDLKKILSYHIISQLGYIVIGIGLFTPLALAGTIFYYFHHIFVKTSLLLFSGVVERITGTTDLKKTGGILKTHPSLAWLFLIPALSIAGIPPLSGFFGKFALVLESLQEASYLIAFVAMFVGLLTLFSMLKIFINAFWGEQKHSNKQGETPIMDVLAPVLPLVFLTITIGLGAQWSFGFSMEIAEQLLDPSIYIDSVLKE